MNEIRSIEVIDGTSRELATPVTLFGTDDPVQVVARASAMAAALKDVIVNRGLISVISKREYVRLEGWTLLGSMIGVFAVLEWTRPVEGGWEARVSARTLGGNIIGMAEAECLRSEKSWADRDDYAIRSMAQTRASAKALRMPLGFIVEMAGYAATPADEMPVDAARVQGNDTPMSRDGRAASTGADDAPHCPTHPRFAMRAGKSGGYYCSSKAGEGEDANEKGYCNYRLAAAPAPAPAGDAHADVRRELSASLVAAQITPDDLAAFLSGEGVDFGSADGERHTIEQIIGFAQRQQLTLAELVNEARVKAGGIDTDGVLFE